MKKIFLGTVLLVIVIMSSGCATVSGTVVGAVGGTVGGFTKGICTDTKNTWNAINKADQWFKENAW